MADYDYDLFVIGGGSGGVRAANVAAGEHGARVALAEESRMGGTCVIRGCVPKKFIVFASQFRPMMHAAKKYHWDVQHNGFHWPSFRKHLHGELDVLEGIYREKLDKSGVEVFDVRARIADPHTVELAGGDRITAGHILVATGGAPVVPPIEGAELGIVSDDMFLLDELPEKMLIIGGGYIACEFACMMHGLGVHVTQYHRRGRILRGFDDEAAGLVADMMRKRGIDLHTGAEVLSMWREGNDRVCAKATNGEEKEFGQVLWATGRKPSSADLGLQNTAVEVGDGGAILVDGHSRTAEPSIYAVGDVTDRVPLTPVAIREGHAFADTVFGGKDRKPDHDCVPSAIFTQPELGAVGLSEDDAMRDYDKVEIYATSFRPMRTAFIHESERALFKLVVDSRSRRILGCHIVAEGAGELIQLAAVAVKAGVTKEEFDATVAVHPTISEELVTMRHPVRTS